MNFYTELNNGNGEWEVFCETETGHVFLYRSSYLEREEAEDTAYFLSERYEGGFFTPTLSLDWTPIPQRLHGEVGYFLSPLEGA